jgi:tripartite-type tricarboxylate transporter receptor subunit TctC
LHQQPIWLLRAAGLATLKLPRRNFLHLAAGAAALPAISRIARAQAYPTRPVHWVVGYTPGGGNDIFARLMGQWLQERFGQPFVIENRPGAGSNIATEVAVNAPADGYTLLLVNFANASNASLYSNLKFNFIRDIAPVAGIVRVPNLMLINLSVPVKTIPEFIAYAKANPGKVNMGSAGIGSTGQLAGELFKMMAGVDFTHVPCAYRFAQWTSAGAVRITSLVHRVHQNRQAARARGNQRDAIRGFFGPSDRSRVCSRI